ncbi:hypothetical protein [Streptomyces fuscichromogenes]|uniref:Uncharacterized protein n=1 Tax=Streptomyces fuscichromogenes TaxID=1324013 RepID=A0A917XQ52_9ACTN|nr:hypothetical protein [Streptomyces fuscichromogenes]GGN46277.1 hypothetical protein GCM10011578_099040 [Streptomyces fuscichromogenes]
MTAGSHRNAEGLDLGLDPDPVERLASLLRLRFGEAWVPDLAADSSSALLRSHGGRAICAAPEPTANRIILQAWVDWDWVTPTAVYTAAPAGHRDLEHWLSCGDLTDAGHAMTQLLQGLLDQLEPYPPREDGRDHVDHDGAEQQLERLAAQAGELTRRSRDFTARLIYRKPVAADARHLVRLASQTASTAARVDLLRGPAATRDDVPRR